MSLFRVAGKVAVSIRAADISTPALTLHSRMIRAVTLLWDYEVVKVFIIIIMTIHHYSQPLMPPTCHNILNQNHQTKNEVASKTKRNPTLVKFGGLKNEDQLLSKFLIIVQAIKS